MQFASKLYKSFKLLIKLIKMSVVWKIFKILIVAIHYIYFYTFKLNSYYLITQLFNDAFQVINHVAKLNEF